MCLLTLIICTYRRPEPVRQLLQALSEQRYQPDEILVIDASPDESTAQAVKSAAQTGKHKQLIYHHVTAAHRGLTRQRNYGIARARGQMIAFLDDDTIPEPDYFAQLLNCFERFPAAAGVGGYITSAAWQKVAPGSQARLAVFRWNGWEKVEDIRNRLRKLLRLDSPLPPGWMPPFGHGRSVSYPPDGTDHQVEFIMGGASMWRASIFSQHSFSTYFEGYGLYEDLDFCVRVARQAPLYLCTSARLAHYHAESGRPNRFHYGLMVVKNGWYVWRQRWPQPSLKNKSKWWLVTFLLIFCRLADMLRLRGALSAFTEVLGRLWGVLVVCYRPPRVSQ
jgi:GT2 family glycosyltransferase